ncbi:biotin-dependent carboxyltransferase family protein [Photobacterium sp. GJ3]|uniref:5-oxoprolinase subunit C family protein n=1 Tax=Photobacterium sp. GJ3 TaxID=2829502 RepID=UPI001B8B0D51|nr:biotin-dependent carboxyltransferase family protein [Photobacterium sp. GJ3]QUJ66633.1 biotin-dependent carboxyltransferase family protein [Photobacterium sp. GJ3]
MTLRILTPGPLSLLQDLGRYGHQSIGVSTGGPMDEHAFLWANRLLSNECNATQIEVTMGQFSCEFYAKTTIAITGADMGAKLNDQAITPWQSYLVKQGDRLTLSTAKSGMRSYLAVKGGFQVPTPLNSSATVMRDALGGLQGSGSKLEARDLVRYSVGKPELVKRVPPHFIPSYDQTVTLEVIPSYQYQDFTVEQRERFFSSTYTVTPKMDRMGCRLAGEPISCQRKTLVSEGIALGAIQIPADGQPIILLRDRQTIGGYPKIGCVTSKGLSQLAQCLPGAKIQFVEKDLYQAEADRAIEQQFFQSYVGKANHSKIEVEESS